MKKYLSFRNVHLALNFLNFLLFCIALFFPAFSVWLFLALPVALILLVVRSRVVSPLVETFIVFSS